MSDIRRFHKISLCGLVYACVILHARKMTWIDTIDLVCR